MAKGDDSRSRNQIDSQGGLAQNHLNNLRNDMIVPQAQQAINDYAGARDRGLQDYGNIMGQYQNFAQTGGFSPQDLGNIRARTLSPLRAAYGNANREVDRSRSLMNGYSPGYGVLKARMAREQGQGMSDAAGNAEANIAELMNSGRKFGVQGQQSLFGTSNGMMNSFGNMNNQAMNNWLQAQGLQNQLGLGLINSQIGASQIPGKFDNTLSRIKGIADIGTGIYSAATGG